MAGEPTEGATSSAPAAAAPSSAPAPTSTPAAAAAAAPAQTKGKPDQKPADGEAKKVSGAELKAKKQADKAARRAQAVAAKEAAGGPSEGAAPPSGDNKSGKPKGKQDGPAGANAQAGPSRQNPSGRRMSMGKQQAAPVVAPVSKDPRSAIPEMYSHLSMAKRIPLSQADKDVHRTVLVVGQKMGAFELRENIDRLTWTLRAFKKVIQEYETPPGSSFSRHFVPHVLNPQIEYLTACRPMCFAMGNAIRLIKTRVSKIDIDQTGKEATRDLVDFIDSLIEEKITLAELIIAKNAAEMINDGDEILTYGYQRLVQKAFEQALKDGKQFTVSIADDPDDPSGVTLAKAMMRHGMRPTYYPHLGAVSTHLRKVTKVMVGAEAMFSNGSLYGPAGTAALALAARDQGTPFIALCETINFDHERVAVDSITYNEIDPERHTEDDFRLMFDTTRDKYISAVVTEYETGAGNSPAQAIMAILRKQEDPS